MFLGFDGSGSLKDVDMNKLNCSLDKALKYESKIANFIRI